ncbi:flavin reductase family protein [Marinomonas epiphytica]
MQFQFDQLSANQRYHLITQTVTPRPIAWILTQNEQDSFNLAPFSYFAALSSDPALLVVAIGNKSDQQAKDTKYNLLNKKECVLHIPSSQLAPQVNQSAANLPYGESELNEADLSLAPFVESLPRIEQAKVALHCRLYDVHDLGEAPTQALYLEVLAMHVDDEITEQHDGRTYIDAKQLDSLGRLGGNHYATLGDIITLKRPN